MNIFREIEHSFQQIGSGDFHLKYLIRWFSGNNSTTSWSMQMQIILYVRISTEISLWCPAFVSPLSTISHFPFSSSIITSLPLSFASINCSLQCFFYLSQLIPCSMRDYKTFLFQTSLTFTFALYQRKKNGHDPAVIVVTYSALRNNRANADFPIDTQRQWQRE